MKKILVLFAILLLYSCSNKVERQLTHFLDDIIENPEKIENLKEFYPSYIDEKYLSTRMKDTMNLKLIKNNILKYFHRNSSGLKMYRMHSHSTLKFYHEIGIIPENKNITGYLFDKDGLAIVIYILQLDERYFLIELEDTFIRSELKN